MLTLLLLHITTTNFCHCDLIEFNRTPNIHQVIFWEWSSEHCRYNARGWLPVEKVEVLSSREIKVGCWTVRGKIRHTVTDYDPERENLKLHTERRLMPWEGGK